MGKFGKGLKTVSSRTMTGGKEIQMMYKNKMVKKKKKKKVTKKKGKKK